MILAALCAMSLPATTPPNSTPKDVKSQSAPDGAALFKAYCASCHGENGKGGGPVADSLRMKPADLSTLKQRNRGEFPSYRARKLLDGSDDLPAHGSRRMPVWGPGLAAEKSGAVLKYLESMQK
jgi:mono/diheme cytochrome c family protein